MSDTVLTPGEWEALISNTRDQAQHLIMKLAAFHGHVAPVPEHCPLCAANRTGADHVEVQR